MKSFLSGLDPDKDKRKHWLSGERFSRLGRSGGSGLVGKCVSNSLHHRKCVQRGLNIICQKFTIQGGSKLFKELKEMSIKRKKMISFQTEGRRNPDRGPGT